MSENKRSPHSPEELEEIIKKFQESKNLEGRQHETNKANVTKISPEAFAMAWKSQALYPGRSFRQTEKTTPAATPEELQKEIDENRRKQNERKELEEIRQNDEYNHQKDLDAQEWSKLSPDEQKAILEKSQRISGRMTREGIKYNPSTDNTEL